MWRHVRPMHFRERSLALVALCVLAFPVGMLRAETVSDTFTLTEELTVGTLLDGVTTEIGDATWETSNNVKFAGNATNGYITLTTGNNEYGGVEIDEPSQTLSLSARLNTYGLPANQWMALAFLDHTGHTGGGNGQLWMILRPSGSYTIFANTTTLLNGTAPNFSSTSFNQVELIYSPQDETLTVKINGQTQLDQADVSGYTLSIGAAGFTVNGTPTGSPAVDDFNVAPAVGTELLISDTFTLTEELTVGTLLNGITTEIGDATWATSSNTKFAGNATNGYITLTTGNNEYGGVTIDEPLQALSLSARLNTYGLPANQWMSFGFLDHTGHPGGGNGQLWMILRPSGSYTIFANTTTLLNGTAPNFSSTSFNQVELIYSPQDETLTVKINGQTQLDQADVSGYTLGIEAAGFAVNGTPTGGPAVDDFDLVALSDDLISDVFEGHSSGNALNGTVTDVGSRTWNASGVTFSGTGVVNMASNSWATVPLTSTENDQLLTVSADMQVPATGGWLAVGFSNNSAASLSSSAKVWALLWPAGSYTLYANGTSTLLASGLIPGFNTTEFAPDHPYNRVDLTYDPSSGYVTLRINSTTVFDEEIAYDPADTIRAAGFQQNGTVTGTPSVDSFRVMRVMPTDERSIEERNYNLMAMMLRRFSDGVVQDQYFDTTDGVWHDPGSNSWHCSAAPGCAATVLWNSLNDAGPDTGASNEEQLQSQATYWDMAVKTIDTAIQFYDGEHEEYHQIAGGGFNAPEYGEDYVTEPQEITTMFWGTMMAQAYLELEDHLDSTRRDDWADAIVGCVTFLKDNWNIQNGIHNWYTNGNIELGEALLLYQTWRITGDETYLDQFDDQWDYLWSPPTPWSTYGYGVTIEVSPTENDYSDGRGYLAEGGAYGVGYDPDYCQLQLSLATNLFLAADAEGDSVTRLKALRLLNLLVNKAYYGDATHTPGISEDWTLDCSYGSRHRFPGCSFNNPAVRALYLLGGRDDLEDDVFSQYGEVEDSYRTVTMSGPSINTYRGLEIDVAMFLLMSR